MWYLTEAEPEILPPEDLEESEVTAEILHAHQRKDEADAVQQASSRKIKRYFGTVPPRTNLALDKVESFADKLARSLNAFTSLDGLLVYHIQEEVQSLSTKKFLPEYINLTFISFFT